jgi:hypothetical protein
MYSKSYRKHTINPIRMSVTIMRFQHKMAGVYQHTVYLKLVHFESMCMRTWELGTKEYIHAM